MTTSATTEAKPSPVEVWLTKSDLAISCREIRPDETAIELEAPASISLRGAQREVTSWYLSSGYEPIDRWEYEASAEYTAHGQDVSVGECVRHFRLKKETR